jgi:hypothetical protein
MKVWRAIAALTAAFALTGMGGLAELRAETHTLASSGSWKAFGGTTTAGRGVCGISGSPGGRYFGLKFFKGDDTFVIQLQVPQVEKEAKVPLSVRFDANPLWTATATGFIFADGDAGLEFPINASESDRFAYEFKNSSRMLMRFDAGGYAAWTVGLEGTLAVSNAFSTCMRGL